jgi:hypothetical protein
LNIICYADNAVLSADSENNLQRLLHQFMLSCQNYHMKISASTSKTEDLTVHKEQLRCKLDLQGNIIEQVMKFICVGTEVTSSGVLQYNTNHMKSPEYLDA